MTRKNNKKRKFLIGASVVLAILLIVILGSLGLTDKTAFTLLGESSYIPMYLSAECVDRADSMAELSFGNADNAGEFFPCTTAGTGKYIPIVNGVECEFYVKSSGLMFSAYECPASVEDKDFVKDKCRKISSFFEADNEFRYSIDAGKQMFINPTSFAGLGKTSVTGKIPSYGLKIETADGRVLSTTTNCELNSMDNNRFHTLDAKNRKDVVPDSPVNVVTGLQRAESTQLVTLSDVNSGKPIYITRPGFYFKVLEAEDGWTYVATDKGEFESSNIECIPRTFGCSDDAKVIEIDDQSCDKFGGSITGYAPVEGDATRLCKYACESGTLQLSNDCIAVQDECPDDEPLWDANTGDCVAVEPPVDLEDGVNWTFILGVIVMVLFIIVLMMLYKMKRDRK